MNIATHLTETPATPVNRANGPGILRATAIVDDDLHLHIKLTGHRVLARVVTVH